MGTEKFWFCVFSYNVALTPFLPRVGSVYISSLECRWTFDCGNETTCLSKLGRQRQCNSHLVLLDTQLWRPGPTCKKSEVSLLWGSSTHEMKPKGPVLANISGSPLICKTWGTQKEARLSKKAVCCTNRRQSGPVQVHCRNIHTTCQEGWFLIQHLPTHLFHRWENY